jgi:hypothetical protein
MFSLQRVYPSKIALEGFMWAATVQTGQPYEEVKRVVSEWAEKESNNASMVAFGEDNPAWDDFILKGVIKGKNSEVFSYPPEVSRIPHVTVP